MPAKSKITGTGFEYVDSGHAYYLDGKKMTGVTTILGVIAKPALIGWAAKETARWIRENCKKNDLEAYSVSLFELEEAVKAHTKKKEAAGTKGTDLHSEVEAFIKQCIALGDTTGVVTMDGSPGLLKFIGWAYVNKVKFLASEKRVYSAEWFVAGTFDFSFEKDGKRYIGDLKSMRTIWDRTPHAQAAAYRKMSVEMGEPDYDGTCIVNINKETNELTESWSYDWEKDTSAFEAALTLYRFLQKS